MTDHVSHGTLRYRPYRGYKDSGIDWLGTIPDDWDPKRLKDCVTRLESGGTPASDNDAYWTDDDSGIPWVAISDMTRSFFVSETARRITARGLHSKHLRIIPSGTLLYSMYASLGKVAILRVNAVVNQAILGMVTEGKATLRDYLRWWLTFMESHVVMLSSSNTQDNLSADRVRRMPVFVPSQAEQLSIAGFLDRETMRIDALVEKKERLIELLEEERAAVITRSVTRGLDPHVPVEDSGVEWLGEIPAHWEVMRLGRLASVGNGSTPNRDNPEYWVDGSYPWLTSGKINEEVIVAADEFVTRDALRECNLPIVHAGSLLVAITGEGQTRGRVALLRIESAISQHLAFVTPKTDRLQAIYLRRFFQSRYDWLRQESSGAGSTRAALTCEFLKTMLISVPPEKVQSEIAIFLDRETSRIDALIAKVREAISRLHELRIALISAAVTGKIDVRESV